MDPLSSPVDVRAGQRGRLAPTEAAAEAHEQERMPPRFEGAAGLEQRPRLVRTKPLEIALSRLLARLLADEKLQVRGGIRPGPPVDVHLPLVEASERAPNLLEDRGRLSRRADRQENLADFLSRDRKSTRLNSSH